MKKVFRSKKGFTLAELLIVIAIIAILAAIAIPVYSGVLEKSRETVDRANIQAVMKVFQLGTIEYGRENVDINKMWFMGSGGCKYAVDGKVGGINPSIMLKMKEAFGETQLPGAQWYYPAASNQYQMPPLTSQKFIKTGGVSFKFYSLMPDGSIKATATNDGGPFTARYNPENALD